MNPLLTKLVRMYGNPTSPEPKLMLSELEKSMSGYSALEMSNAMQFILPKSNGFFPSPELIIEACRQSRMELARERPQKIYSCQDDEWSRAARQKANDLIASSLGQKAADEGWIGYLWDFCRKHRRHPTPDEQIKLIRAARRFDETIENGKKLDGEWAQIGMSFAKGALERRRILSKIAYGGAA